MKRSLIRISIAYLHLFRKSLASHNNAPSGPCKGPASSAELQRVHAFSGGLMAKLAIFLVGFLTLTLLIGALATISPL
ncbi:hypothetical protein D9M71_94450 [compost metagenome]